MAIEPPYPALDEMMALMGEAGQRLAVMGASEGASGNLSVYLGWDVDPARHFPDSEPYELPTAAPELAGRAFLVTGSGRRMRDIQQDPAANLAFIRVGEGGRAATLHASPRRLFSRPTLEFNSHLAVHRDQAARRNLNFHAVIHAQPLHLVYLSHIGRYQDASYISRHVLRWQPETVVNLPEGLGFIRFMLPGSPELMLSNVKAMRDHQLVVWGKHGIMVRSDVSIKRACDLIEYAEVGARFETLNLGNAGVADGMTQAEIRMICDALGIEQKVF